MTLHKPNPSLIIQNFLNRALSEGWIQPLDENYLRNRFLTLLDLEAFDLSILPLEDQAPSLLDSMDQLTAYALETGLIEDIDYQIDQFEAQVMDLITPLPSQVNQIFWDLYAQDPKEATDYFYKLSQANDYIKTRNIAKNLHFTTGSEYGDLEITINLSKPEKDPKQIALERESEAVNYPACALCMENEGYQGRINHPARQNHRIVRMEINDELYGMQYSPYVYYNEHSIFLSEFHRPMHIDRHCFANLLALVDLLPHYFVGSNTDLPIVGGSILSHDHYQGGRHTFPMDRATIDREVEFVNHPQVQAAILNWPMSVIRLTAQSKEALLDAAEDILLCWRHYDDEAAELLSHQGDVQHSTVTPIARRLPDDQGYRLDLVLRNNRTSQEYPDGLFHPHPDVQHIKKENIGLIEVMGLAILPPRLLEETQDLRDFLLGTKTLDQVAPIHQDWAQRLAQETQGLDLDPASAQDLIQESLGQIFARVLEDAGIYKRNPQGQAAFDRFIQAVNQTSTK